MFNKFQVLVNQLLSEDNSAGAVFGNATADPNNNIVTTDDIKTTMAIAGGTKKTKKKKRFFPVAKRKLPETVIIKR